MASIEQSIIDYLKASPEVVAVAGEHFDPGASPQGTAYPRATYVKIADQNHGHLAGKSRMREARLQIGCWSDRYAEAQNLATLIETRISRGMTGVFSGLKVRSVSVLSARDAPEVEVEGSDVWLFQRLLDVRAWYVEPDEAGINPPN